ncbi:MAG: riboflavin synthase [Deferribacterota bacterium]|nr:riboflavin synthase [Deferribacterota bacterium]
MFTGIINEVGRIIDIKQKGNIYKITIESFSVIKDLVIGDSICVNGVCLTITKKEDNYFIADLSKETFNVSAFSRYRVNNKVNLERPLKLMDKLSGHIVLGHVDCIGKIQYIKDCGDFYIFGISCLKDITRYIAYKGSIAIDGISLTISKLKNSLFEVTLIPHTFKNTNLCYKKSGDYVNLEIDVIARYIERLNTFKSSDKDIYNKLDYPINFI